MNLIQRNTIRYSIRKVYIQLLIVGMTIRSNLCRIICKDSTDWARLLIAVSSLTWAVLLLEPSKLFATSRTTYSIMRVMFAEDVWGILFLISGLVSLYAILFGVRNRVTLVFDALLGAVLWSTSTLACFAAHWPLNIQGWWNQLVAYPAPAAMSGEFWLSVAAWWHLVRHVTDHAPLSTTEED